MALVNEYNFSEMTGTSLTDSIGTNTGTFGGATNPVWTRELDLSKVRNCLAFTGGNGYPAGNRQRITLSRTDFAYTASTSFSLVILAKSSKLDTTGHMLFSNQNVAAGQGFFDISFWVAEDAMFRITDTGGHAVSINSGSNICDGSWHLLVMVYDSSTKTITGFVDGKSVGTSNNNALTGNFVPATSQVTLGCLCVNTTTYNFDLTGSIAYFANYNHALSATEVQRITEERLFQVYSRDAGATYRYLPPKNPIRDGLYFSHPLMGGSNDISGNAYNATDTSVDYSTICSNGLPVATYNGSTSKSKHSNNLTLGNVFSFGCWFKTTTAQTSKWIMGCYTSSNNTGGNANYVTYALIQSANSSTQKLSPFCVDSAGHSTSPVSHPESSQVINDGKWHRCIVVVDAANGVKMYLDGKISTITAVNMSGNFNGRQPNIGCCNQLISNSQTDVAFWTGSIRDAFCINRSLIETEVDRDFRDTYIN